MSDLNLSKYCDHWVADEQLTIDGTTPNYYANLLYTCDGSSDSIEIRMFSDTEGITNFNYVTDGFTNWRIDNNNQIYFNAYGMGSGCVSFLDGSTLIYPQPLVLMSYYTSKDTCPKCDSAQISNDISFRQDGNLKEVSGTEKLRQIVYKALMTSNLATNEFHTDYGTEISGFVGNKFDVFTQIKLQQEIQNAINLLIEEQSNTVDLPLKETLLRLSDISIRQDPTYPNKMQVVITVKDGTFEEVKTAVNLLIGG